MVLYHVCFCRLKGGFEEEEDGRRNVAAVAPIAFLHTATSLLKAMVKDNEDKRKERGGDGCWHDCKGLKNDPYKGMLIKRPSPASKNILHRSRVCSWKDQSSEDLWSNSS